MSNATLLLEALELINDAYDRLERTSFDLSEADGALRVSRAGFHLASARKQLNEILFCRAEGEVYAP